MLSDDIAVDSFRRESFRLTVIVMIVLCTLLEKCPTFLYRYLLAKILLE